MPQSAEYVVRVEPCPERLRVEFNGVIVADSPRALVLHETRLPDTFYFPWSDVRSDLLQPSAHRTHCPFKGDASYWSLAVDGKTAENAVWAYEDALPEVSAIRHCCAFDARKVDAIHHGTKGATARTIEGAHPNPLVAWLLSEAWRVDSPARLVEAFCAALESAGVPIARMTVIIPTLHPQVFASVIVWRNDEREARTIYEPHDILHRPKFAASPFAPMIRGGGGIRRRLEGEHPVLDFPVLQDLHGEGATDYAAMPFRFSDGQINVMSMTSFAPGGFTTAHLGTVHEVLPILGRLLEGHAQRRISVGLLETYLGRDTGKRVLEGQIKHGDGDLIHAVIWFCDLRGSTHLSVVMEQPDYLRHLNRFFMAMAGAIHACGGEILSYIGDAVLAIFPIAKEGDPRGAPAEVACRQAAAAVRLAEERVAAANAAQPELPALRYGIGLHVGDVTYGNIGIPERLQFTVIGCAANEASRIESMTKELDAPVLASSLFVEHYTGPVVGKGTHLLRGTTAPLELFALA